MIEPRGPLLQGEATAVSGKVALDGLVVTGYALDPVRPDLALVVELLADGSPLHVGRADLFVPALAAQGRADHFHGFAFRLALTVIEQISILEVRLANGGPVVGEPVYVLADDPEPAIEPAAGAVAWLGGLRFGGWTALPHRGDVRLRGLVDEDLVVEAQSSGWTTVAALGGDLAVPTFDLHLPRRFADGHAHVLEVLTSSGEPLPPGPVTFVAFEDGLRRFLAERSDVASEQLRGALFDRLIPQSLPFAAIDDWRARFPTPDPGPVPASIAVALIGEDGLEASLGSLQDQAVNWTAGVLPRQPGTACFAASDLLAFLEGEAGACEVVVFADGGTLFLDHALGTLASRLLEATDLLGAYPDTLAIVRDGPPVPLALPAFDAERMLEQGYAARCFALTRETALRAARSGADSLFRLFGSGVGPSGDRVPLHVPGFLVAVPPVEVRGATAALVLAARHHCRHNRIEAEIQPVVAGEIASLRLSRLRPRCSVSVVVTVRNDVERLHRCLAAIQAQRSRHAVETVVVDNDSSSPDCIVLLERLAQDGARIVHVAGARNGARLHNHGASAARGDLVLFLDQKVALATPDAIDEMAGRLADDGVAAVGAVLTWPSGVVRDGGQVLSFRDGASAALSGHAPGDPGYAGLLGAAREVSALSGDLLMVRRTQFRDVGGMDEIRFPLRFPAVAFCLGLRAAGHRVVLTPHARAMWTGAAREVIQGPDAAQAWERELIALRALWPDVINDDAFYNPQLALNGALHSALAWPPRAMRPRLPPGTGTPTTEPRSLRVRHPPPPQES